MDNSEIYIYLGFQDNTYFFVHFIYNNNFTNEISYQIYNVMFNSKIFENKSITDNVIIYEFNDEKCNIISIHHINNVHKMEYEKDNLEDFFDTIKNNEKNELYIIKYDYSLDSYFTYILDNEDLIDSYLEFKNKEFDITIDNIYYVVTSKIFE